MEGAEEEDEDSEGAAGNVVLFDDVSGLSDLIWRLVEDEMKHFFSVPVEMISDLLYPLSPDW